MSRRLAISLLTAGLLIGVLPLGAAASTPVAVTIDIHEDFAEATGTFTAQSAVLCVSGTTSTLTRVTGSGATLNFHSLKTFTCADGSGTFTLRIQARVMPCAASDWGSWSVAGGTGDYEDLHGTGTVVGTYFPNDACDAEGIDDHLTGRLIQG